MYPFHSQFKLNTQQFNNAEALITYAKLMDDETHQFLKNWFDETAFIKVLTSGSTAIPKEICLKKEFMVNSAKATATYFNLHENTTALLCMSPKYIAGKMMLVRAMVLGWELDVVDPVSNPLKNIHKNYDFCAMVPMQIAASLDELYKIKILIVGGGAVSHTLKQTIQKLKTQIFATYGMTETITHIAIQKLNHNPTNYFECLPNIKISKDNRGCLVINAPLIADEILITNDLVSLINETAFKWLGRFDNVINSGGVKLFPEQIEKKLTDIIANRFFIASKNDELFGEKVILVIESAPLDAVNLQALKNQLKTILSTYEIPKALYFTPYFVETDTKKIQRSKTLDLIFNQLENY